MPSPNQLIAPLPYFTDSAELFAVCADKAWAVFLDSGFPGSNQGRYDIIAAEPVCTLVTHGGMTEITCNGAATKSTENPFDLVKQQLHAFPPLVLDDDLPFNGGAIGYFSYDLARRLEALPAVAKDEEHIAEMAVGIYEWAVIVDHHRQKSYLVGHCAQQKWQDLIRQFSQLPVGRDCHAFKVVSEVKSNMDKDAYV
ncbi:MAG: aminodeoxychorismate synthase component I, partial [Methylobacter sp.]